MDLVEGAAKIPLSFLEQGFKAPWDYTAVNITTYQFDTISSNYGTSGSQSLNDRMRWLLEDLRSA